MLTYQDLQKVGDDEEKRTQFVYSVISQHKMTDLYKNAVIADEYDKQQNRTIVNYQKLLYTMSGEQVPDNFSANYKLCSNFFNRFVTQQNQYLLSNGVTWQEESTGDTLGKDFDFQLQKLGRESLVGGVAFGFWNLDHMESFSLREFAPLYDEENGALMAGVRWWQVDETKPLRATLYEIDGYTNYMWSNREKGEIIKPKQKYVLKTRTSTVDGTEIYDGENYPGFPIIPMWGSPKKQSELIGIRENIDAYDLIKSGFANDLDDASQIYWTIQNAGGMDDVDLAKFLERMKTVKAAVVEENGATAESHTIDVPYNARETILMRLRNDLYDDYMALDTKEIANGATTATQIKAAYEPMNSKADQYEYCIIDFLNRLLTIVGISDQPTFTRSTIVNTSENIMMILQSAEYLPQEYVTEKMLNLLGDGDRTEEILEQMQNEEMSQFMGEEDMSGGETSGGGSGESIDENEVIDTAEDVKGQPLNGAQTQSLILIMTNLAEGKLNENQAINMIATAIGISKREARAIVEGTMDEDQPQGGDGGESAALAEYGNEVISQLEKLLEEL